MVQPGKGGLGSSNSPMGPATPSSMGACWRSAGSALFSRAKRSKCMSALVTRAARHRGAERREQYRPTGRTTAIDPSVSDIFRPVFRHGGRGNRQGQMVQPRERLRLYHSGYRRRGRICSRICPRTIRVNGPQRRGSRDRRHRRGAERAGSGKGSLSVVNKGRVYGFRKPTGAEELPLKIDHLGSRL